MIESNVCAHYSFFRHYQQAWRQLGSNTQNKNLKIAFIFLYLQWLNAVVLIYDLALRNMQYFQQHWALMLHKMFVVYSLLIEVPPWGKSSNKFFRLQLYTSSHCIHYIYLQEFREHGGAHGCVSQFSFFLICRGVAVRVFVRSLHRLKVRSGGGLVVNITNIKNDKCKACFRCGT